ncbi:tyrosine-type recombinase/integrase [Brevibacterium zhoupengii]|uniref:tyrosine-type recombinase/integrase n=1 Tax=Brevibacterium zhoupengii TaxID=2898795 RepID=UPI001E3874DD|nr:site-specific integrase [Brevibacterium zhoupengii]
MAKTEKLPTGINRTPKGKYRARVYFQGRQQSIGQFDTLTDAKAGLSIAKSEIVRGVFVPMSTRKAQAKQEQQAQERSAITVDQVVEDYLKFLRTSGKARGTIYTYESRMRTHLQPKLGHRPIADITVKEIEDWFEELTKTRGRSVSRSVYLTTSAFFNYAAGNARGQSSAFEPLIDHSPCKVSGAAKHHPERRDSEPVASLEAVNFVAESVPTDTRLAILLAAWCALRMGEILALQRQDFQEGEGHFWVSITKQIQARGKGLYETEPKSEAGVRTVPVPAALNNDVIRHLRTIGDAKSALVFPRAGEKWNHPNTLRKRFNNARDLWNAEHPNDALEYFTFHSLRHTALTRIGQAGATLEELKRYAGHSSAEVVAKYQHATRDRLAMLAGQLSDQIKPK